jgi:hypothetical protein
MRHRVLDMRNHWLGDAWRGPIVSFYVVLSTMTFNVKVTASVAADLVRPGAQ